MTALPWVYHDGGRGTAPGHGGATDTGDCVVRAVAVALDAPYEAVYAALTALQKEWCHTSRSKHARAMRESGRWHARHGVHREVIHRHLSSLGWVWTPTMGIGSGTTVHLAEGELPGGRLVANLSKHVCAVVDGVVHDTHDPCRDGTRCVYGYWLAP